MQLHERNVLYFDSNFTEDCSWWSNSQKSAFAQVMACRLYSATYSVATYSDDLDLRHRVTSPGPRLNIKMVFAGTRISMLKIRRSRDRLIFNMGIPILVRRHIYIETAPRSQRVNWGIKIKKINQQKICHNCVRYRKKQPKTTKHH